VAQLFSLGIIRAMRHSAILLAVAMLALSGCSRTSEFKAQAELGQPIVRAIEDYHKQTGSYPASLDELHQKFSGWDYRTVTNATAISYSVRFYMGRGGVEYQPPDWIGNDEGQKIVILSNR
jgi:hypothetical protein